MDSLCFSPYRACPAGLACDATRTALSRLPLYFLCLLALKCSKPVSQQEIAMGKIDLFRAHVQYRCIAVPGVAPFRVCIFVLSAASRDKVSQRSHLSLIQEKERFKPGPLALRYCRLSSAWAADLICVHCILPALCEPSQPHSEISLLSICCQDGPSSCYGARLHEVSFPTQQSHAGRVCLHQHRDEPSTIPQAEYGPR